MRRSRELSIEEKKLLMTSLTDEEAFSRFERSCQLKNLRPATIRYYRNELSAFKKSLKEININKQLSEVTQKDVEDVLLYWKESLKIVTINTRLRALKAFYTLLKKEKFIKKNPVSEMKQLRDRRRIIETLTDEEIKKIAQIIKKQNSFVGVRDFCIFLVMLDTGIRLSEICGVEVEDVQGNKLRVRITKNLEEREVYLSSTTQGYLKGYLRLRGELDTDVLFVNVDNGPLKPRAIQSRFNKYKNESRIQKQFSPHILRHTFAKRMVMSGIDAFSLAALLGHSDLTVTKRYVSLWGSDLEQISRKHSTIGKLNL
ncbi:tyrosine-type recombinase/integrase [Edaphobacillus lindanitolerans]|uniref:Site-specific recombinase XerD n=1 Tax=Edaphobacillus lindanitolerans TaxID=550447 RepID=A0A1U7PSQ3_9BACI|nr:tyrosine-type recombinase/integrase [Edaphobacillus lindanitolerans]SIT90582.1 Site-specific recombinase XerD [Edaphobacillus lindanitolerans]